MVIFFCEVRRGEKIGFVFVMKKNQLSSVSMRSMAGSESELTVTSQVTVNLIGGERVSNFSNQPL